MFFSSALVKPEFLVYILAPEHPDNSSFKIHNTADTILSSLKNRTLVKTKKSKKNMYLFFRKIFLTGNPAMFSGSVNQ